MLLLLGWGCPEGREHSHSCFVTLGALPGGTVQHLLRDRNPGGFWKELCVGRSAFQWDVNIEIRVVCARCHFPVLAKESEELVSLSVALTLARCPSSDVSPGLPQEMLVPEWFKIVLHSSFSKKTKSLS